MLNNEQLIGFVKGLKTKIGAENLGELFQPDSAGSQKKIGHGQFRELAALCKSAQCYDEIELLVQYNTAKANETGKNASWAKICNGQKKFGNIIVEAMQEIRKLEPDEREALKNLSKFFGYLYWQSRVWTLELNENAGTANPGQGNGFNQNEGGHH